MLDNIKIEQLIMRSIKYGRINNHESVGIFLKVTKHYGIHLKVCIHEANKTFTYKS